MTETHEGESWRWTRLPPAGDDTELAVERFGEHPDEYFEMFPRIPAEERGRIPHTFSMLARKPSADDRGVTIAFAA
jgi:hypothetical protein